MENANDQKSHNAIVNTLLFDNNLILKRKLFVTRKNTHGIQLGISSLVYPKTYNNI